MASSSFSGRGDMEDALATGIGTAYSNTEELSKVVLDPLSLNVIAMCIGKRLTVQEMALNLDVSAVTLYALVKELRETGMLVEAGSRRTSAHGTSKLYTSIVKGGSIVLREGCIEIECLYRDGTVCTKRIAYRGTPSRPTKRRRCLTALP